MLSTVSIYFSYQTYFRFPKLLQTRAMFKWFCAFGEDVVQPTHVLLHAFEFIFLVWLDYSCPPCVYLPTQLVLFLHVVLRFQLFWLVLYLNQGSPCARLAFWSLPKSVYGITLLPPPFQIFARAPPPPQRHPPQPSTSLHPKHCCEKCTLLVKTGYHEHFLNVYLHYYKE